MVSAPLKLRRRSSAALPGHGRTDLPVRRGCPRACAAMLAAGRARVSECLHLL